MRFIPVAREGWPFIIPGLVLSTLLLLFNFYSAAILFCLITLFIIFFFRDPERGIIQDESVILSPADGKIIYISEKADPKDTHRSMKQVSIFMSLFNCHINRAPISGRIIDIKYNEGIFLPAFRDKASELNEQNTLTIHNGEFEIRVCQIAGVIARRIVCKVQEGDTVSQGERFGLIRFGSRVDLYIPSDIEVLVKRGEMVKSGISVIARIRS